VADRLSLRHGPIYILRGSEPPEAIKQRRRWRTWSRLLSGRGLLFLKVARSLLHGQGCFTTREVSAGGVVAKSRLLVFPPDETERLTQTQLKQYLFFLRDGPQEDGPFYSALAMGPVSFCNHASEPNCDFRLDEECAEITLIARRGLARNEEITIDYGDYAGMII
jgi:hypothetical protein